MLVDLQRLAEEVKILIRKYMAGGTHEAVLKMAVSLRHERLAHRQVAASTPVPDTFDVNVECFYADNSRIVALLMHLVKATAYDPSETAGIYRQYSKHFWAAARGEQTEGRPNYRKPTRS